MRGIRQRGSWLGAVLATVAAAFQPTAHAQGFDPPDTVYTTGDDQPIPESVSRSLPVAAPFRAFLPVSADLSGSMPVPGRQGRLSSCAAWAVAYAARSYYAATFEGRDVRQPSNVPSPAYVYHLARGPECSGTSIVRNVEVLRRGAPSLAAYPYADQCAAPPGPQDVAAAADFRVRGYRQLDIGRLDDLKGQLAQANPVLISFADSVAFHKHRGDEVFSEPTFDKPNGWHAMTLVGYDDRRQAFRLINSWGQGWGDRGFAWVSYDVIRTRVRAAGILDVARPPRPPPTPGPAPVVTPQPPPPIATPIPPPAVSPPVSVPAAAPAGLAELQRLPCARITGERRSGRTLLSGFVASTEDEQTVRRVAAGRPDVLIGDIVVAPWPQCEAMQTLDTALTADDRPLVDIGGRRELREGEQLRIVVRAPAQPRYLYVSYIQVDGSLVHLVQPRPGADPVPSGSTMLFGDGSDGRSRATISAPFGREMIIAIATRSPLFPRELPTRQTDREYLSALRRALIYQPAAATTGGPVGRDVSATVLSLDTRAR